MKALGIVAVCLLALIAGGIIWYWEAYPTYTYRYRLTVEVEVDGQVKSGSGVIEAVWNAQPANLAGGKPFNTRVHGEAVLVDLGGRRPFVVTLWSDDALERRQISQSADRLALRAFGLPANRDGLSAISHRKGRVNVPLDALPMLITFVDANDPKTVRAFTLGELQEVLGPGVRFRAASVEITDAPVSRTIRDRLTWLKGMKRDDIVGKLHGGRYQNLSAQYLIGEAP
jgi:hypothetical protein